MTYRYKYTTLLYAGTFTKSVTTPHICESPLVDKEKFRKMRRAIRVRPDTYRKYERAISRLSESMDSLEIFEVMLIMPVMDDMLNLIEDIREINRLIGANKTSTDYNIVEIISDISIETMKNTKIYAEFGVACRKAGMVRS